MRSTSRQVALPSTAALAGGRRHSGRRGNGGAHQAVAPYLRIARRVAQPVSESIAAEKSSTVAIANSVAFAGGELSWSMFLTIVGASGREGSKTKMRPSAGLGAKPTEPEIIASITASQIARADARTVPATIAGRAVRTAIFQVVRQRFTPRASDPSSHPGRTDRSPSEKIETISGAIITVSTVTAASRL